MNNEAKSASVVVVMVKYIAGGKDVVMFDKIDGRCWVERTIRGETTIIKSYVQDLTL